MYIRMQHPNYIYILAQRSSKTHMCKENENVHTVCPRTQGSGSNRCRCICMLKTYLFRECHDLRPRMGASLYL